MIFDRPTEESTLGIVLFSVDDKSSLSPTSILSLNFEANREAVIVLGMKLTAFDLMLLSADSNFFLEILD